jgi:hypothetical protein
LNLLKKFAKILFKIFFSANDVALVIKYKFSEETSPSSSKRKKIDDPITNNILNYSQVKLPAMMLVKYLNEQSLEFVNECLK